jgi:chorismate mutase
MMKINDLRTRIDAVDEQLVRLLNVRAQLAIEIGRTKRAEGIAVHDPQREREILRLAIETSPGVLDHEALEHLFHEIVRESRRAAERALAAPTAERPELTP